MRVHEKKVHQASFKPLPARRESAHGQGFAPPVVHEALRSSGRPLDETTRAALEPRFGHDFSRVRVHTDARAAESARAVGAQAYTVGSDIVFDRDSYAPGSAEGQRLLAHELTHVSQQQGGSAPSSIRLGEVDSPAEAEAQSASLGSVASNQTGISAGVLQRSPTNSQAGPWSARRHILAGMGYFDDQAWSSVNADGHYSTSDGTDRPFSQVFTGKLCTGEALPLNFAFHVDSESAPRPQPFNPSTVAITLNYLTGRGQTIPVKSDTSTTHYFTPGMALLTGFSLSVPFAPPEPGRLLVSLIHNDPSSSTLVTYADEVPVVDCPGKEAPKNQPQPTPQQPVDPNAAPRQTNYVAVVPDPDNNPYNYHLMTKQDGIDVPGLITPVDEDQWGTYYTVKGKKYYIPDPRHQ